jgi:hypothetical protein
MFSGCGPARSFLRGGLRGWGGGGGGGVLVSSVVVRSVVLRLVADWQTMGQCCTRAGWGCAVGRSSRLPEAAHPLKRPLNPVETLKRPLNPVETGPVASCNRHPIQAVDRVIQSIRIMLILPRRRPVCPAPRASLAPAPPHPAAPASPDSSQEGLLLPEQPLRGLSGSSTLGCSNPPHDRWPTPPTPQARLSS